MGKAQFVAYLRHWPWYCGVVVWIVADQYTKWLASSQLMYAMPHEVLPFLNMTLMHNPGAAFSFLSDAGGWQRWFFALLSAVVSVVLMVILPRQQTRWSKLALAMILSGALGNLYDRVALGYVVDFISVHHSGWYFPTFNLADTSISLGAAMLIIDWLFLQKNDEGNTP